LSISDQERVEDILEFAQTLASLVEKGQDKFRSEVVLQLSIERLMISIGEACSCARSSGFSFGVCLGGITFNPST